MANAGPLLYLLGGPMRTGKSIIASRFNSRAGVSIISSDHLTYTFVESRSTRRRISRGSVLVTAMAEAHFSNDDWPLLIEGELEPAAVQNLMIRFGSDVRACFVGDLATSIDAKSAHLAAHGRRDGRDWLREKSPLFVRRIAGMVLKLSIEYRDAAVALDIPFFDMSPDFEAAVERVLAYLQSGKLAP